YADVLERLAALPGVESAALIRNPPTRGGPMLPFRIIGGDPGDAPPITLYQEISADFFETLRVPLLRGRLFSEQDNETAPGVAIVNETFARQYFGDGDPIGQSILVDLNTFN